MQLSVVRITKRIWTGWIATLPLFVAICGLLPMECGALPLFARQTGQN